MHLTRSAIAHAALKILDQYGLGDVSMRRVAAELGVAPGALYWHIANKQALISSMAELICADVVSANHRGPREFSTALRAALFAHRDGADVVSTAAAQPNSPIYTALTGSARATLPAPETLGPAAVGASSVEAAASGLVYLTLGAAHIHQSGAQLSEATAGIADAENGSPSPTPRGTKEEVDKAIELLLAGLTGR